MTEAEYWKPFFLGLSSGLYCVGNCFPFMAPLMAFRKRTFMEQLSLFWNFMTGRFIGYILFGGIFGYLGQKASQTLSSYFITFPMMLVSMLLILYSLGAIEDKNGFCGNRRLSGKTPWMMGLLTGINLCPPFLLSLSAVFLMKEWWQGVVFFAIFFVGTAVYFIPVFFLGSVSRFVEVRLAARIGGLIAGFWFLGYSIMKTVKEFPAILASTR